LLIERTCQFPKKGPRPTLPGIPGDDGLTRLCGKRGLRAPLRVGAGMSTIA